MPLIVSGDIHRLVFLTVRCTNFFGSFVHANACHRLHSFAQRTLVTLKSWQMHRRGQVHQAANLFQATWSNLGAWAVSREWRLHLKKWPDFWWLPNIPVYSMRQWWWRQVPSEQIPKPYLPLHNSCTSTRQKVNLSGELSSQGDVQWPMLHCPPRLGNGRPLKEKSRLRNQESERQVTGNDDLSENLSDSISLSKIHHSNSKPTCQTARISISLCHFCHRTKSEENYHNRLQETATVFSLLEAPSVYFFNNPPTRAFIGDRATNRDWAIIFSTWISIQIRTGKPAKPEILSSYYTEKWKEWQPKSAFHQAGTRKVEWKTKQRTRSS